MLRILAQSLLLFETFLFEGLELILQVLDVRGMPLLSQCDLTLGLDKSLRESVEACLQGTFCIFSRGDQA
jgi:hypothetical protein